MLEVKNVTKKYGKQLANDHISLHVEAGETSVLLGPNGAGKSTLIKCIAGLLRFEGEILLGGHSNKSIEAKRLLAYVPELPATYDLLTVREHMEFIRRAYQLGEDSRQRAEALMERFELSDKGDKMGKELSKGMQQKISLCLAMLIQPKVIIFDEPLVGLDPHAIKEVKAVFRELKEDGAAVLISTHMLDTVEDTWDSVHIMMNGRFAAERKKVDGADNASLEELFFKITEAKEGVQ